MNFLFSFAQQGAFQLADQITWWHAIILGLVQGLTEFIPVSSSAHLNITHWIFGQDRELTYDVVLHIGTLFALAYYFRNDWRELLTNPAQKKLRNFVFIACVPAVIAGVLLRDLENKSPFSDVAFNAGAMIVMGLVLLAADRLGRRERTTESLTLADSLLIGCSQALALVPGVSRSGATLTMGLFRGLTREDAARFSFLMSLPITLGAVLFQVLSAFKKHEFATMGASPFVLLLGVAISAASGFWAIGFLLNYLKRHNVILFVVWRLLVALLVYALILTGIRHH